MTAVANVLDVLDGRSLDRVLAAAPPSLGERDRALAAELSFGVCRWYRRLDALVAQSLRKPLKKKDRDLQVLLLVGAYQLLYSRIPPHAAVSTTVEASRRLGKAWASKLINGVLRRLQRDQEELTAAVDRNEAVRYALPDWLYGAICAAWPVQRSAILPALQARPPMVLRVDLGQTTRGGYLRQLVAMGVSARPHPSVPTALVLDMPLAVERLPGFAQGLVSVQDAGAQLAGAYLDLRPGQRVLDACAAPGGKTLDILQRAADLQVTAVDMDGERLRRVDENLRRAGHQAALYVGDAASPQDAEWGRERYQRILLDVPCSATGVLRRHPDIRLLRRELDIVGLVERQAAILAALWPLLLPGGRLLYVTCSLLPLENVQQLDAFLTQHADAEAVELPAIPGMRSGRGVQLLPGIDHTDGFFYAAVEKRVTI
ncbi:MAG: 16S rRNA (cytosine(967)-C(5))-methyltransferase RsmB [Sedimenticolaceae bacterium]